MIRIALAENDNYGLTWLEKQDRKEGDRRRWIPNHDGRGMLNGSCKQMEIALGWLEETHSPSHRENVLVSIDEI